MWGTVDALGFLLLCVIWSTTWQAIRVCLTGYPPFLGAGLRFLLAVAILAGLLVIRRRSFRLPGGSGQHLALFGAGVVNGLGYALVYVAEQTLSGGTTAILCASSPLFTLLFARLFGLEPLIPRRIAGMSIGLAGIALLFWDGQLFGPGQAKAMVWALLAAAVMWPLYGALLKRHAQNLPALVSTLYFLFYTALCLLVLAVLFGEPLTTFLSAPPKAHLALLYLAVSGSVVAWTVYLSLLRRIELSVLSTIGLLQPLLALALDFLLKQTQLGPRGYAGTVLVVAAMGLSLAPWRGKRPV